MIRAIKHLYESFFSGVRISDGFTDFFKTLAGVPQGDTLAPFLFITALDYVLGSCIS